MPGNPDDKAGDAQKPDGEAGRIETIEGIAARQQQTDAKVDSLVGKIDQLLGGGKPDAAPKADAAPAAVHPGMDLDAIKRAIRDVGAEEADAKAKADHDAEHERLKAAQDAAEHAPREAMQTWKGRLQRAMFGGDR